MQNNAFNIKPIHEDAAATILGKLLPILENKEKVIVTVSGEVASGKSPVSLCLGRQLKPKGYKAKLIDLDDFYHIAPLKRRKWREEKGMDKVGIDEIDWALLNRVIKNFKESDFSRYPDIDLLTDKVDYHETDFKDIKVLIIHGLYSLHIKHSDLRVFMEMTWPETLEMQRESMKEVIDDFRLKVLNREQEVVKDLKQKADMYIDLNTSLEIFHL